MVSTRSHPQAFPPPQLSPTKRGASPAKRRVVRRSTPPSETSSSSRGPSPLPSQHSRNAFSISQTTIHKINTNVWSHNPSKLTLLWLFVAIPLVVWDTLYIFLRPHSMGGGKLVWPLWVPYELYATVDYVYGWPAYHSRNGFSAAQAALNAIETTLYIAYLWIVFKGNSQGKNVQGRGGSEKEAEGRLVEGRSVSGRMGAWAVVIGLSASAMTLSKTVLYWFNEYFGGFENVGHNDTKRLVLLWIIPNGLWLIFPAYMGYVFSQEILDGLERASGEQREKLT